jgi:hypothetical protein
MAYRRADNTFLPLNAASLYNFLENTTYYFSPMAGFGLTTVQVAGEIRVPATGTLKEAYVMIRGTADTTNEPLPWYIEYNGVDYLIDTISTTLRDKWWHNKNMSIPVTEGTLIYCKVVCPNPYVTPPNGSRACGYLRITH